jgi:hypothetical protein
VSERAWQLGIEKADNRHRQLLGASERPGSQGASD